MTYLSIASMAKATRLFWPPDRLSMGRKANSPDTPNEPSCLRYSSSGFPGNKNIIHDEWFSNYAVDQHQDEANIVAVAEKRSLVLKVMLWKSNSQVVIKYFLRSLQNPIVLLCCIYLETVTVTVAQNSYSCLTDPRDVGWNTPVSNSCKTNWKKIQTLLTHCFLRGFSQNE